MLVLALFPKDALDLPVKYLVVNQSPFLSNASKNARVLVEAPLSHPLKITAQYSLPLIDMPFSA